VDGLVVEGGSGNGQLIKQMEESEITMPFGRERLKELLNSTLLGQQEEEIAATQQRLMLLEHQSRQA